MLFKQHIILYVPNGTKGETMITITARSFWNAENALNTRNFRRKVRLIRKDVEKQLRKQLASVKSGALPRNQAHARVTVEGMFFPDAYEKELNKRGFVVLKVGEPNIVRNTQRFHIVIKGCEDNYLEMDFDTAE